MHHRHWVPIAVLALSTAPPAVGQTAMTVEELQRIATIGDLALSPDGQWVTFEVSRANVEANNSASELYIAPVADSARARAIPLPGALASDAYWRSDSKAIVVASRAGPRVTLWSMGGPRWEPRALVSMPMSDTGTRVELVRWSHGGRIAYVTASPRTVIRASGPLTGMEADIYWMGHSWGTDIPLLPGEALPDPAFTWRAWVVDDAAPRAVLAATSDSEVRSLCWSGDSAFVFTTLDSIRSQRSSEIRFPEQYPGAVQGRLFFGSKSSIHRVAMNGRHVVVRSGGGCGDAASVVHGERRVTTLESGLRSALVYRMSSGSYREAFPADEHTYYDVQYAEHGSSFAAIRQGLVDPPEVVVGDAQTGHARIAASARDLNPFLAHVAMPIADTLSWMSTDGRFRIHAQVLLPPAVTRARPAPMIVSNIGGPNRIVVWFTDRVETPDVVLASRGYVILYVNSRGRGYPGDSSRRAIAEEQSYVAHPFHYDIMPGIDTLVRRGIADSTRLGIAGFSAGGGLTAYAVTQTDRFRAAEVGEPVSVDYLANALDEGGSPEWRGHMHEYGWGQDPYDSIGRRVLEAESPLFNVQAVHTPVLTECGAISSDREQCVRWFQGLRFVGVPSELVIYPRAGHGWEEPRLVLDSYRRNIAWFDYWLRDVPYPDSARRASYEAWKRERALAGDPRWSGN
jgi:dipeptidyl aminopeptidase/acylaminoacyl peptidase